MASNYGQIGNSLRQRDIQYVAHRDERGTWRILDTWSSEMAAMTLTDDLDIPDTSAAVLVLTEGQFLALMKEVEQQGYMPAESPPLFNIASEETDHKEEDVLTDKLMFMTEERNKLLAEQVKNQASSESHELSMRKLDLFEIMSNKGNLELEIAEIIKIVGE